ncbi:hypothetical protein AB0N61_02435 [Microbacterium sp. NPDC089320]|uniref:hypothetical protein n=1 Tax=Microbacterium sp. NPDC089320 TaxID=3155182 RepID=UPI003416D109
MISLPGDAHPAPRPVVQEVHRPTAPLLRYIDQIVGSGSEYVEFRFSQGVLTRFDIDILHVADENLGHLLGTPDLDAPTSPLAAAALVRNLRKHDIALVRTLSRASSETPGGRSARWTRSLLDKATEAFIVFDESTPTPDAGKTTLIPHAHYRDRFIGYPRAALVRNRILSIAAAELPAATAELLGITRAANTAGLELRVVGSAAPALMRAIESEAARHPRHLSARLEALSDGAQVQEIDAAELTIVPETRSIEDYQTLFLVLSLDRPVLTPGTEAMKRLAQEVGPEWLHLSDGPVTADALDLALARVRAIPAGARPNLDGRSLQATQNAYGVLFEDAAHRRSNS